MAYLSLYICEGTPNDRFLLICPEKRILVDQDRRRWGEAEQIFGARTP